MAHFLPKQRRQSLFCSTTSTRRKSCVLNLESSTMLLRQTGTTSGGNVFPYSFPWGCRRQPVTREMKQRAGEILSEALPSNSSGEEDRESKAFPNGRAGSRSPRGKTRSGVRAVPPHDDFDSTPTSLDAASSSSPKPHNVKDERRRGQPAHRGPPVLSELRGKLKEAAGHRIKTLRWRHVNSEAKTPTRRQPGAEHVEAQSSVQVFDTYEVNKKGRSRRRRLQGRMPRRVLLFDTVASTKGFPTTDGSDSDTLVHPCHAHAAHQANSSISTSSVFSYKEGCSDVSRPSQRRMRPHQSSHPTLTGPVFPDVYSGIAYDTVDNYSHQQQQQPHLHAAVPLRQQRQSNLQHEVVSRPRPQPSTNRDTHQQEQHYQRYACHPLTCSSRESDPCGKGTHKPTTDASRAEATPCGGAESVSRVLVGINVIRTIVHEAAALRIAWSLQNILRRHVSNAVALLRYKVTIFNSLYRINTPKGTYQSSLGQPEETSQRVPHTTVVSTREARKWAATSLHTSGRKAGAASDAVSHQVPERLVWPSCCGGESDSLRSSVPPAGLGRVEQRTRQLREAGARLLVHELRVLLLGPTTRLAWNQLKRLQEEQRLSQHVCKLYESVKVTSQWAATFTRAAAAKIILRVAELAFQRCTLRALLLLKAPPPRLQPERVAGACCASEPRSVRQCQKTAETQGAAVLSVEEDSSRCATPQLVAKKCFTPTSLSDQTLQNPAPAARTFSSGGTRRTQGVGRAKECVERQQFEREAKRPPCSTADHTNASTCSAEITTQPRGTVDCIKLHPSAAAVLGSSCGRLNDGGTQSPETEGRTHNREGVSGVMDTPVSSTEGRESGTGWSKTSEGQVHKVLHPIRAPPSTNFALSEPVRQPIQILGTEDQIGRTVVVCKTLTRGNPGDNGQQRTTNVIIERSSPSPFLPLNAAVKSLPSASIALAIDEVTTSPVPFTQDKLRVAGVRE